MGGLTPNSAYSIYNRLIARVQGVDGLSWTQTANEVGPYSSGDEMVFDVHRGVLVLSNAEDGCQYAMQSRNSKRTHPTGISISPMGMLRVAMKKSCTIKPKPKSRASQKLVSGRLLCALRVSAVSDPSPQSNLAKNKSVGPQHATRRLIWTFGLFDVWTFCFGVYALGCASSYACLSRGVVRCV